ncbi:MAG: ribosome silencing factor [Rickettsiales bacterium]|nr:ribosome silencing factor [Rickettsiales bacterium]
MNQTKNIRKFLEKILKQLDELKAIEVVVVNIEKRSALADFFIIASGSSSRHINSIASKIVKTNKRELIAIEGLKSTDWVILDFGDIILNLFKPETRKHYNLEKIWQYGVEDEKMSFG